MKNFIALIIALSFCFPARGRQLSDVQKNARLSEIANKSGDPEAAFILSKQKGDLHLKWIGGNTKEEVDESYGTVIHESCHRANGDRSYFELKSYLVFAGNFIVCEKTAVYPSKELSKDPIAGNMKTFNRYDTYISEAEAILDANKNGIYGLLEEFCAYYQGAKAEFLFSKSGITETYQQGSSTDVVNAYYEFSVFMARYLKRSKARYPAQYKQIVANQNFKVAYTLLDQQFSELVKAVETSVAKEFFSLDNKKDLTEDDLKELSVLKISGLTKANHASKLTKIDVSSIDNKPESVFFTVDPDEKEGGKKQYHVVSKAFSSKKEAEKLRSSLFGAKNDAQIVEVKGKYHVSILHSPVKAEMELVKKKMNDAFKGQQQFSVIEF